VCAGHTAQSIHDARERRIEIVRLRNLLVVGALGFVAAALPAMASSETTATISAKANGTGPYPEPYSWSPSQATIAQGASVTFSTGSTSAPHGIVWTSSIKPTCDSSVPVGETNYREHWSGSCTFTQPGTYTFHCSVHTTEMIGSITVTAAGTTTTSTTTTPPPTPTTTTPTPIPKPPVVHPGNAKKLAKALRACRKKPKGKRAACIKRAHRRYGPKAKK
jgi:plastocyanin